MFFGDPVIFPDSQFYHANVHTLFTRYANIPLKKDDNFFKNNSEFKI